jgi:predicted DNA-binding protein
MIMNDQITTVRLPAAARNKLAALSRVKHKTKSDIIKESLDLYYEREETEIDSFTLGESYFGSYGSGETDRAAAYKEPIKEKLRAQLNSH